MRIEDLPDAHLRVFDRPAPPEADQIESVYLISICGTGMGSLATLLQEAGYQVSGADEHVYPPMSTRLAEAGIPVHQGFDPAHLTPPPDLTIVGNACTPTHVEAAFAREKGLPQLSFPEAIGHLFLQDRQPYVVAGTHGKTTTTALLTHLLSEAGLDPGFLVGGVLQGHGVSAQVGTGAPFVIEGDEYDCAYFDKRPKFAHYRPHAAIVTSMELDHTDIYPDWERYEAAFLLLAGIVDADGVLILCGDHPEVCRLREHTAAGVKVYGVDGENCDVAAVQVEATPEGQSFTMLVDGEDAGPFFLPMHGRHNLSNALAASTAALHAGLSLKDIRKGLSSFAGIKRRQEVRGEVNGILVLDDFAHHPTAVRETVRAIRHAYPDRRLVAVFEPRSNSSRRKVFEDEYPDAFAQADVVCLTTPLFRHNDREGDVLDAEIVAHRIQSAGIEAHLYADAGEALTGLLGLVRPGDAVLIMSNGSFGGIHQKLLDGLRR